MSAAMGDDDDFADFVRRRAAAHDDRAGHGSVRSVRDQRPAAFVQHVFMHLTRSLADGLPQESLHALESSFARAEPAGAQPCAAPAAPVRDDWLFGASLSYEGVAAVQQLIDYLAERPALHSEGLFRRQGAKGRIAELRKLLCVGQSISLHAPSPLNGTHFSVDDVACCFKEFLTELPQPLCPDAHLPVYETIAKDLSNMEATTYCEQERRRGTERCATAVGLLVQLLPGEHSELFGATLRLLNDVAAHRHRNLMCEANLAKLFVPVLFYPHSKNWDRILPHLESMHRLLALMISQCGDVLRPPSGLVSDLQQYCARHPVHSSDTPDAAKRPGAYWASCGSPDSLKRSGVGTPASAAKRTPKGTKSLLSVALARSPAPDCTGSPSLWSSSSAELAAEHSENSIVCCDSASSLADRHSSARCKQSLDMDVELAQMYAHVQAMPDGPLRQRMMKKFAKHQRSGLSSPNNAVVAGKKSFLRQIFAKTKR